MIWTAVTSHGARDGSSHPLVSNSYVRHMTTSVGQLSPQDFSSPARCSQQWARSELASEDNGRMTSRSNVGATATVTAPARRHRYSRSTTASVTQMLSESCSSLLQRLTTRVRGPSTATDHLGVTRTRLEDKYSAVLDRYGRRREPVETETEPSPTPLAKSATTANVLLSEKAYPYVSAVVPPREKTPYRHGEHRVSHHHHHRHHHHHDKVQPQPEKTAQEAYSSYRTRHKSGQGELRTRHGPTRPVRVGKSEQAERRQLRLCPVEIDPATLQEDPDPQPEDGAISEREAKRKEIQSLILKYSALDEAYNRLGDVANPPPVSTTSTIASKYQHKLSALTTVAAVSSGLTLQHESAASLDLV